MCRHRWFALFLLVFGWSARAVDGALDPTFNSGGAVNLVQYANLNLSDTYLSAKSVRVLIRPDQRMLVVGYGTTPLQVSPVRSLITTVALTAQGALDSSYFGSGRRNIELVDGVAIPVAVIDAAFQTDGSVVILSQRIATNTAYLIRLSSSGNADTSFGSGGIRRIDNIEARALVIGSGNEIYVLGGTLGANMDAVVHAYTDHGAVRTDWGFGGQTSYGLDDSQTQSNDWFNDGFVRADGLLYVVGEGQVQKFKTRAFRMQITSVGTGQEGTFGAFDFGACNADGVSATRLIRSLAIGTHSLDLIDFEQDLTGCGPSDQRRYLMLERVSDSGSVTIGFYTPQENERVNDIALSPDGEYVYLTSQVFPVGINDAFARVVRYRMTAPLNLLSPDSSFGVNGFADFFAEVSATQSAAGALAPQQDGRLVVAGGISTDVLGNAANHNTLVFRVDREGLFKSSFE